MKVFLALLGTVLAVNCVNADWSGKGILACYGHFETDASFDEGAANGGDASVNCAPAEWGALIFPRFQVSWHPKPCFSLKNPLEKNSKSGPGISMNLTSQLPLAMVPYGTKKTIWVQEFAPLTSTLKLDL